MATETNKPESEAEKPQLKPEPEVTTTTKTDDTSAEVEKHESKPKPVAVNGNAAIAKLEQLEREGKVRKVPISKGLQSTINAEVKAEKPVKKAVTTPVVKQSKAEIEKRLAEIDQEKVKQTESLNVCTAERRRLEKSKIEVQQMRDRKVDSLLEEHFKESTSKGVLDKVLQSEFTEPKLVHLMDNIQKLQAQELWHRKRLGDLAKEELTLQKQEKNLAANAAAVDTHKAYLTWKDAFFKSERCFDEFKAILTKARSLDPNFAGGRLQLCGIDDPAFVVITDSKMHPDSLYRRGQSEVISDMAKLSYLDAENPFYSEGQKRRLAGTIQGWND